MDGPNSLERRYSFNIAQGNPVAESTHLNGSSFSWGSSMSPKYRSNSYLNDAPSPFCYVNGSILSCKTKNLPKIDARIAADIQSKGLASRIVKYHESGTRLNRSMSAHNLYSRPGQFPAVTLKKTELPYRAAKQELSMIRIATPEKSSFYGNTISGLLRSSSVIGLHSKRSEDLSRENRPIIHPPPTEDDMAPTRSVLDVLKEISRKRINSDNLETEETSKKYCCRRSNDFVDSGNNILSTSCQRYKRQRDCITPHHDGPVSETQTSPEQAKKRVCSYNNDITSSLSSSKKWKKISGSHNNQTMPTNLESHENQKSGMNQDHYKWKNNTQLGIRFENLVNNLGKVDEIKPIASILGNPSVWDQTDVGNIVHQQSFAEPFLNSDHKIKKNLIQPEQKARLTLFNKKCDDNEKVLTNESCNVVSENTGESIVTNVCADIPFVKPKAITSKSGLRNPLMLRAQKSKLALMLRGLKGELYVNTNLDEIDSPKDKDKLQSDNDNRETENTNAVIPAAKSSNTVATLDTVTATIKFNKTAMPSNLLGFSPNTSGVPSSSNSSGKKTSPLVGLKVSSNSPPKSLSNSLIVGAAETKEPQSKSNVPALGGFSFSTTFSNLESNTSSNDIVNEGSNTTTTQTSCEPITSSNILDFGQSTVSLTSDDKINKVQPLTNSTTGASISGTANTSAISKTFNFGLNVNTPAPVGAITPFNSASKLNNDFSFTFSSLPAVDTSCGPKIFGTSTCSDTLATKANSTSIASTTTNATTLSTVATSENFSSSPSTPPFTFQTIKNTSTSNATTISSTSNSLGTFDIKSCSGNTSHLPSSCFTFSSGTKVLNSSIGDQIVHEVDNQNENKTSNLFASQNFNTKTAGSADTFGKITNSFENVLNSPSNVPSFSSSSTKSETTANNKAVLVTPTVLDSNKNNNSTTNLFSFASKSATSPAMNTNNFSSPPGGFSFSSAISNSEQSRTYASTAQANNLNTAFSDSSRLDSKNSFKFATSNNKLENSTNIFGVAINKQPEHTSTGGFSFASGTSMKSAFTFGTGNNSPPIPATSSINPSTGFAFAAPTAAKSNGISSSKPFAFGPPQSTQQKQIQPASASNGNSPSLFSLSSLNNKTVQPTAFNFTGSLQNLQSNAPPMNNLFAPSPSGIATGPGDRLIRRATRRLQK